MRDFLSASNYADLVQCPYLRAQATVDAEDFTVNDGAEDEKIKDLAAAFPDGCVTVFLLTFFVKTIDLGDLAGFMIAPHEGDAVWIPDFETEE